MTKQSKKSAIVSLNIEETKKYLKHVIENNRYLQKQGKVPLAVAIDGESGLGKTSLLMQLSEEIDLPNSFKLNLAQIEELGDLVGYPVRQFEMKKTTKGEEEVKWVDEPALESFTRQGFEFTGKNQMGYCPPFWIAGKEKGGILILDDWTRADMRFIQAVMELIDRQTYISWKLPKDWHIILTSNPDNGEYFVNAIDNAQRTRFISFNLKFDSKLWAKWAETEGIDGRCINFLILHPEVIKDNVNPRAITNFFNSVASIKNFEAKEALELITNMGEGSIGPEVTTLFTTFIHNRLDKLMSPEDIFDLNRKDKDVVDQMKDVIGDLKKTVKAGEEKYRADIANLIGVRMVNYTATLAEKNPSSITKDYVKRLCEIISNEVFAADIRYWLARETYNLSPSKFAAMCQDKIVVKYILN